MGMATRVAEKTATVSVVLLEYASSGAFDVANVIVLDKFEVKVDEAALATQLGELATRIEGQLRSLSPDRVVVRRADSAMRPSNKEGPKFRLLLEGALTSAAQRIVSDTALLSGRTCASTFGTGATKDSLDALAMTLVGAKKYAEAAAAALSAAAATGR